jgi:hypothetical protein
MGTNDEKAVLEIDQLKIELVGTWFILSLLSQELVR